jgi:hypothetical protein
LRRQLSILLFAVIPISVAGVVFTRSCAIPRPAAQERLEGMQFARLLLTMMPESQRLSRQERGSANKLKVLLDEVSSGGLERFQSKIDTEIAALAEVREGREKLRDKMWSIRLSTPLPQTVRDDVNHVFDEDKGRVESWVQIVQNLREREELGKEAEFPEVTRLNRLLDLFLGISDEEPVQRSLRSLRTEYGLTDREIFPQQGAEKLDVTETGG